MCCVISSGFDNFKTPTASPQTYFHPHNPGPLPHVSHMSTNCPHGQRGGVIIQPLQPPSMRTGSGESYFVPMGAMHHPLPVSPTHRNITQQSYTSPTISHLGAGYIQPNINQVLNTPSDSRLNNFTSSINTMLPQNPVNPENLTALPPCQVTGDQHHCCKCQAETNCPSRTHPGSLKVNHESGWAMDTVSGSIKTPGGHLLPYPVQVSVRD